MIRKIIAFYAKGQTTRDISERLKEMYGINVSHTLIAEITKSIVKEVQLWQQRSLDSVYPIIYLDCIVIKVHQDTKE